METMNRLRGQADLVDLTLGVDWSHQFGSFRCYFDDDRWVWSPQVEQMHGYQPGTTAPSTLLVLSHLHLDDYRQVAATLHDVRRTHQPFSSHHRIVDTHHHQHDVVVVGAPFNDKEGAIVGMHGFFLDVTSLTRAGSSRNDRVANHLRVNAAGKGGAEDRRQRIRAATQC